MEAVAAEMGAGLTSVARMLRRSGVESRPVGRKRTVDRERVAQMRAQGMNYNQIAGRLGCSRETIRQIALRGGG